MTERPSGMWRLSQKADRNPVRGVTQTSSGNPSLSLGREALSIAGQRSCNALPDARSCASGVAPWIAMATSSARNGIALARLLWTMHPACQVCAEKREPVTGRALWIVSANREESSSKIRD